MSFQKIKSEIETGKFAPVYFFSGEETWSIDVLTDLLMDKVLTEAERDFNQHVFYSKDTEPQEVINTARRYPVFSERQLVVLKEGQHYRNWDVFMSYLDNPVPSTVLVINHKHKKVDLRTAFGKAVKKKAVYLHAEKLREHAVPGWIKSYLQGMGKTIDEKSCLLIVDHLGNDLSKISNELDKLGLNLGEVAHVTGHHIEEYIGISKDFNAFELTDALAARDFTKAMRIVLYFEHNPKAGPLVLVLGVLFNFYSKLYQMHHNSGLSDSDIARVVRLPPFVVKEYKQAMRKYPAQKTEDIIGLIARYDAKSKGIGSSGAVSPYALLKELIYKIMH